MKFNKTESIKYIKERANKLSSTKINTLIKNAEYCKNCGWPKQVHDEKSNCTSFKTSGKYNKFSLESIVFEETIVKGIQEERQQILNKIKAE